MNRLMFSLAAKWLSVQHRYREEIWLTKGALPLVVLFLLAYATARCGGS